MKVQKKRKDHTDWALYVDIAVQGSSDEEEYQKQKKKRTKQAGSSKKKKKKNAPCRQPQ